VFNYVKEKDFTRILLDPEGVTFNNGNQRDAPVKLHYGSRQDAHTTKPSIPGDSDEIYGRQCQRMEIRVLLFGCENWTSKKVKIKLFQTAEVKILILGAEYALCHRKT
jgi:hypothetical protein